jgi:hypothetical protein
MNRTLFLKLTAAKGETMVEFSDREKRRLLALSFSRFWIFQSRPT